MHQGADELVKALAVSLVYFSDPTRCIYRSNSRTERMGSVEKGENVKIKINLD